MQRYFVDKVTEEIGPFSQLLFEGDCLMNFGQAISTCMGKYATFSGRASRSEFWWFYLFTLLLSFGCRIISPFLGELGAIIILVVGFGLIIPIYAAGSRRLHDIGKSGWWQLLVLTGVGIILIIVWFATHTKPTGDFYNIDQSNT